MLRTVCLRDALRNVVFDLSSYSIVDGISSADKQTLILENSSHAVAEDIEHLTVFKAVADFITMHT